MRRFGIALCAVAIATLTMRGQIAGALVVRGDELLIRNEYDAAAARYVRALWFDPQSESAVDRLSFLAVERRTRAALLNGERTASAFLDKHPASTTILFDRGLCYLLMKNYRRAFGDFRRAAKLTSDPQQYVFAGWAAKRSGDVSAALRMWKTALTLRHRYRPATAALEESR